MIQTVTKLRELVRIVLKLSAFYILEYLCSLSTDALRCLSVAEIMRATQLSRRTVHIQLKWLVCCSYLSLEPVNHWTFRITISPEGRQALKEHHEFGQVSQL
jgi:DNA-binding IclR family transcriptional regulator